ncbi:hypothetical protein B0H66DRAFT_577023 [Apodospora peruviana]|uniref:Uncharacterized protein n=1 Tax=Apodospora peruviana TaxID=516989 RepID=A0AAE0M108_9PEZI|nr:hypothetical protein B0H66DRAFT_577023 [Apodospora peruviana]
MAYISLSTRDINILEKIKDPESDPSLAVQVDASLPRDPNILNQEVYEQIAQQEREIILSIQKLELRSTGSQSGDASEVDIVGEYRECISRLGHLIETHQRYASAYNNRAQALRRLCGDWMLVSVAKQPPQPLLQDIDDSERLPMARTALNDLDTAIQLLTPTKPYSRLSPQTTRTLSMAHTQRAAIYHTTSKLLSSNPLSVDPGRREADWTKLDFEENASRDFAMGGRYGNEIAKGLAVSTNPTAKLCGQMVREAMKNEYGLDCAV